MKAEPVTNQQLMKAELITDQHLTKIRSITDQPATRVELTMELATEQRIITTEATMDQDCTKPGLDQVGSIRILILKIPQILDWPCPTLLIQCTTDSLIDRINKFENKYVLLMTVMTFCLVILYSNKLVIF